ncbi:MAG TPA: hypothetical protein VMF13_07075 [Luteitalea sp.]|nr:hypothetical protein [Luteitalea sp.]
MRRLGRLAPLRTTTATAVREEGPATCPRTVFVALLLFCLTIPSNWTQDVPAHYGARHPGLRHSWLYPALGTTPRPTTTR